MIQIRKCLQDHLRNDLIKYCQDYGGFQGVSFFTQETKINARDGQ